MELRPNTLLSILPWQITAVTEVAEPLQYHLVIYNLHTLNRYIRAFSDERGDAVDWLAHIERQPALYCNEGQAHRMQQFFLSLRERWGWNPFSARPRRRSSARSPSSTASSSW